jgi:hypothetical protein
MLKYLRSALALLFVSPILLHSDIIIYGIVHSTNNTR